MKTKRCMWNILCTRESSIVSEFISNILKKRNQEEIEKK